MEYTIKKLPEKLTYYDNNKKSELQGYAFLDKFGGCIIIAWGENRRDFIIKELNSQNNLLGIKYKVYKIK